MDSDTVSCDMSESSSISATSSAGRRRAGIEEDGRAAAEASARGRLDALSIAAMVSRLRCRDDSGWTSGRW
jgi:hypothetical protein